MMTQQEAKKILLKAGIIFDENLNISQFGGLEPFIKFLEKGHFKSRLESEFGIYKSRSILQIMLGLIVGAKSMNDIGKISKDPLVVKFLKNPVEEAQLGRDVRSFMRTEIESFHDFNMSLAVLDFVQQLTHDEELIFDVDATAIEKYGYQEGVEKGYVGKDDPEKCYQYLLFRLHNRNSFLYGTIRGGSSHSQNDFCGYLQRFLPLLKSKWKSRWRADSGYFNEAAFDLFVENQSHFFIKAPMIPSRLNLAQTSSDLFWSVEVNGVSYASRKTKTAQQTSYVEIFKRTKKESSGQMSLGELATYRYDCLATSDLAIEPNKAFEFYNGRANIENNIRELKNDYNLGKIVTDNFDANDVITQATMLTYILMRHFQNEFLPEKMKRHVLGTIRNHVFNIPALFRTGQRRIFLKLKNVFCEESIYAKIIKNLNRIRSWILRPPEFT